MINRTFDYVISLLSELHGATTLLSSTTLSERTRVPAPYAVKVLKFMVRAGWITSRRGPSGGYRLVNHDVTLADVFLAFFPVPTETDPVAAAARVETVKRLGEVRIAALIDSKTKQSA